MPILVMASPVVQASLDKNPPNYPPGTPMKVTGVYSDADSKAPSTKTGSVTVTVADAEGNKSAPVVMPYTIPIPGVDVAGSFVITATDPDRVWTVVDNKDGTFSLLATAS